MIFLSFESLRELLSEINNFFINKKYSFGFFRKTRSPKSLISSLESLNKKGNTVIKTINSTNTLIFDLNKLHNKDISDIEKARIRRFIKCLEDEKNNLANERGSFLRTSGIIAAGIMTSGFLNPMLLIAKESLFDFKKGKVIAYGSNIFENINEIIGSIIRINLFVVRNRKLEFFYLERESLNKLIDSSLVINGYIIHIEIFTTKPFDVYLEKYKFDSFEIKKPRPEIEEHYIDIKNIKSFLISDREDMDFLKSLENKNIFSYFIGDFPFTPMLHTYINLINKEESSVIFGYKKNKFNITIKQNSASEYLKVDIQPKESYDDLKFIYLGNNITEFDNIKDIREKLTATTQGIYNVEKLFGINIINKCLLIDYNLDNASYFYRDWITLYTGILINFDSEMIKHFSEHETLHALDFMFKIRKSKEFNQHFADLLGYKPNFIFGALTNVGSKSKIFGFIESNYLEKFGGHPKSNIVEFFASFVHTIMYIHILNINLEKLNKKEFVLVLEDYKETLKVLIKITPDKINYVFKQALHYLEKYMNY